MPAIVARVITVRHLLVVGGARSGKSAFAQARAEASGRTPVYVATAQPFDDEMRARIAQHVAARGDAWTTLEAPVDLPGVIGREGRPDRILLVDCLTLWLNNLLLQEADAPAACAALVAAIGRAPGPLVLVSNEVGSGIVPANALARRFGDLQGRLNQMVGAACDGVVFVAAGQPVVLKPAPPIALDFAFATRG